MKISEFVHGRDNNFNLIRMVAACTVLVTHSFALVGEAEPFQDIFGMTIGAIAVDIFFVTSGFLITASLLTRQRTIEFLWARVLRIFPALLVMLLLTVFGLGTFFTTLPLSSYLTNIRVYKYFVKNLILITGVSYELPGVFDSNPVGNAVNGSLWTLSYEIWMYGILAAVWVFFLIAPRFRLKAIQVTIISSAFFAGIALLLAHFNLMGYSHFLRLFFWFFIGSAFFILKDRIVLSHSVFAVFAVALFLASLHPDTFFVVYTVTLAYIVIYLAYIPSGFIRQYNKLGDYSYGVYIYAYPVQQSIAALIPGIPVLSMFITSTIVTFVFAILSWHLFERHALKLKGLPVNPLRRLGLLKRIQVKQPPNQTESLSREK